MADETQADAERDLSVPAELSIREPPKILIPVEVLDGESVPEPLVEFLAPADIVVLGYHVLPEQTPAEQASMQFEDRAREAVEDIAHTFRHAGRDVETRVAFTHDRDQTVERVAREVGATAVLLPNPSGAIEDVLVALRGAIDVNRVADLVATLVAADGCTVTVLGVDPEGGEFDAAAAVDRVYETLLGRGLSETQLSTATTVSERPIAEIVDRSAAFDAIVMGEGGPSLLSALFGDDAERVAQGAVDPVLVVRGRPADE
jgi:nucleotide-binding universal stress UspA family protein